MIHKIIYDNILLAIIIRAQYSNDGIEFFTNDNDSQQLGYMARPKGYTIQPHRHNLIKREVHLTQEVLYVKKGKVRVDFFDNQQSYLFSDIISEGDVILLSDGGHGFQMLENTELIEVKQGPYCGEIDKVRFNSIEEQKVNYITYE
jgi:hypothetical protein